MAGNEEMFKTTLMGGYDKEDVQRTVQRMRQDAYSEKSRLLQIIKGRDRKIEELKEKNRRKNTEVLELKKDIEEKYRSYIEHYDMISKLIYEAQVKSEQTVSDAEAKAEQIVEAADAAAEKRLASAQAEIDQKISEGQVQIAALQKEKEDLLDLVSRLKDRCLKTAEVVEEIVNGTYTGDEEAPAVETAPAEKEIPENLSEKLEEAWMTQEASAADRRNRRAEALYEVSHAQEALLAEWERMQAEEEAGEPTVEEMQETAAAALAAAEAALTEETPEEDPAAEETAEESGETPEETSAEAEEKEAEDAEEISSNAAEPEKKEEALAPEQKKPAGRAFSRRDETEEELLSRLERELQEESLELMGESGFAEASAPEEEKKEETEESLDEADGFDEEFAFSRLKISFDDEE